jgi:hypothetical protein
MRRRKEEDEEEEEEEEDGEKIILYKLHLYSVSFCKYLFLSGADFLRIS